MHAAIVEIVIEKNAEVKYSTVQNWYPGDKNGKGGIYNFVTKRGICKGENAKLIWAQVENRFGNHVEVPEHDIEGRRFRERVLLRGGDKQLPAGGHGNQDDLSGIIPVAASCRKVFRLDSVPILTGGKVKVVKSCQGARNFSQCDSLLLGDKCGAHTFPYLEVANPTAQVEHEATTSKIGEDQIFYCNQRGISTEDAIGLIIKGYAGDVINKMPMEFAVEAQKLLQISLAGSVG